MFLFCVLNTYNIYLKKYCRVNLTYNTTFASLVCVPVGITCSAIGIKICAITAGIKKYKSTIKKKKKKHDKIVLLGKDQLNTIKGLISKAFNPFVY